MMPAGAFFMLGCPEHPGVEPAGSGVPGKAAFLAQAPKLAQMMDLVRGQKLQGLAMVEQPCNRMGNRRIGQAGERHGPKVSEELVAGLVPFDLDGMKSQFRVGHDPVRGGSNPKPQSEDGGNRDPTEPFTKSGPRAPLRGAAPEALDRHPFRQGQMVRDLNRGPDIGGGTPGTSLGRKLPNFLQDQPATVLECVHPALDFGICLGFRARRGRWAPDVAFRPRFFRVRVFHDVHR